MVDDLPSATAKPTKEIQKPFRWFDLPTEIRQSILRLALHVDEPIDVGLNAVSQVKTFLVSRRFSGEAVRAFYGSNTFRILPTHPKAVSRRAKPVLRRIPRQYRSLITAAELRFGPHWSKPPKCWVVNKALGLEDLTKLRRLDVFAQADPSQDVYRGFRVSQDFYTFLASSLLTEILEVLPSVVEVRMDNDYGVARDGPLVGELVDVTSTMGKRLLWGTRGSKAPATLFPLSLLACPF